MTNQEEQKDRRELTNAELGQVTGGNTGQSGDTKDTGDIHFKHDNEKHKYDITIYTNEISYDHKPNFKTGSHIPE